MVCINYVNTWIKNLSRWHSGSERDCCAWGLVFEFWVSKRLYDLQMFVLDYGRIAYVTCSYIFKENVYDYSASQSIAFIVQILLSSKLNGVVC